MWTFSQNFSSLALTVCDLWYYEDLEEKAHWLTDWLNDKAVYRTALATPGLLNSAYTEVGFKLKSGFTTIVHTPKFPLAYVALWDPESTQFQCYLGPSPRHWRTFMHFNVVLTVFHIDHIFQNMWKTVRTTFLCTIVLQSWGEGHEKEQNYGTDSGQIFRTFSPQLENNDTLKCSSDSFAHTLRYVVNVENCQNYIEMFQYPPIAEKRS